jgi:hypothetical protein
MPTFSSALSNLGSIAAILQLFVTSYLSYKVYDLTQKLYELEEYDQKPGKLRVTTTKSENQPEGFTNFDFEVKNHGEGRIEVRKIGFPIAKNKKSQIIRANSKVVTENYSAPLILDPGESFTIKGQFKDTDLNNVRAVGIDIFSEDRPEGFRNMTDSGTGNF